MNKAIKRIQRYQEYYELSSKETLYLVFKYHGININITASELTELITSGILDENGDFIENLDTIKSVVKKGIVAVQPMFHSDISKKVYQHLLKFTCYKNPYTQRPISINPSTIKLDAEAKLKSYEERCIKLLKKEKAFYKPYNVFLSLFPTATVIEGQLNNNNTKWTLFFRVPYSGVNLRKKTTENTKKFLKIIQSRDTGVFLYGVYLFIRSGIKGDQTFIPGQANFFKEWEDWYEMAENIMDEVTDVEELFKVNKKSEKGINKKGIMI